MISKKKYNKFKNNHSRKNNNNNNKNFDGSICSPNFDNNSFTCFSKKSLKNIINSWNNYYNNNKIIISHKDTKSKLWNKIDNMLKKTCNSEYCWTTQSFLNNNEKTKYKKTHFKPIMPKKWNENINEWLNTYDIEKVMNQYTKKYKNFHFIGPVPIDFDTELGPGNCVIDELCKININNLIKKKKTKLGIIFNLDKHSEPGSHWVSFFTDFENDKIYYFDSYGYEKPNEVSVLIDRFKKQASDNNKGMDVYTNHIRHQFKNSECGVYSMHFIIKLLENNSYEDIIKNIIKDDDMQENRQKYYINTEEYKL